MVRYSLLVYGIWLLSQRLTEAKWGQTYHSNIPSIAVDESVNGENDDEEENEVVILTLLALKDARLHKVEQRANKCHYLVRVDLHADPQVDSI